MLYNFVQILLITNVYKVQSLFFWFAVLLPFALMPQSVSPFEKTRSCRGIKRFSPREAKPLLVGQLEGGSPDSFRFWFLTLVILKLRIPRVWRSLTLAKTRV